MSMPDVPFQHPTTDPNLPSYPSSDLLELIAVVDAAHANCPRTRTSMTGLAICLAGAAIAYKSKRQTTVATSSTEAELIAACYAGKIVKYLRSVLAELGFPQNGPTTLYEDNQAAIAMVNENHPTAQARHIDIQYFAIQEWRQRSILRMAHLPGVINNADQSTKALSSHS